MSRPIPSLLLGLLLSGIVPLAFGAETAPKPEAPKPNATTPDAAPKEQRLVYIAVVGAPGDGEKALSEALANRLAAIGVASGSAQATNVYLVEGTVKIVEAKSGRQGVRIDWTVFAPDGRTLGGVSQMKLVRRGTLDKKWGAAADAAARDAASEIVKLLPQ
jgi:hypothetical protein